MLCPMLKIKNPFENFGECKREDCAWWDEKEKQCCIKTISKDVQQGYGRN